MVAIMPFDTLRIRQSNLLNFGGDRRAAIARRAARPVAGDRLDRAAGDFADAAVVGDTDIPGRIYRRVAGQRQLRGGRGPRQHVCRRIHPQCRKANREVKVAAGIRRHVPVIPEPIDAEVAGIFTGSAPPATVDTTRIAAACRTPLAPVVTASAAQ
jgi:hypothetical protein